MASFNNDWRATSDRSATPFTGLIRSIAVIIPAHNEAGLIGRCLRSVEAAIAELRLTHAGAPAVQPIVVLDACTDGTADAVAAFAGVRRVAVNVRRVGTARRIGADVAMRDGASAPQWLACTDADSVVPARWLTTMLECASRGADLVVGTVRPDDALPAHGLRLWQQRYQNVEGHRHVHGANLGISAAAYRAVGGWPNESSGEDQILVRRAVLAGLSVVRTAAITVETSGRLQGRAPDGFASYLSALVS